ncbi:ATP-dependent DNA helicase RecG [Caulobacter ginsengisoli]|uniref:ATP-dependent DNA helicase RecG n=1 Tax=Caulobacter ginsengisoli TaxID=400775 RepID=A0ABU0IMB9_9CAUL|nr:ATP-dependent DNA helicase RecG [Caulobacter ginsengisoli]MDQ0463158.1 ATP-dependent DNA helicase RecG [Caulobacter ginsengisoli]
MRPEILFPLFAPATSLKGVGPKVAPALEKVAGPLVRDVALLAPTALVHREPTTVERAREGETGTFIVTIESHQKPRGAQPWKIRTFDETGFLSLIWFKGHGEHLERSNPVGARRAVSGKVERFNHIEWQMAHPDYILDAARVGEIPRIETVYPATAGLASRTIRKLALEALSRAPDLPEWQDPAWLAREQWPSWRQAMEALHNPVSDADLSPLARPRRRLAYDELLAHQLALAQRKAARRSTPGPIIPAGVLADKVQAALPYRLTGAQIRSLAEVRGDLLSGERMSRLLQGDVGAGKTVVAMLAMADVAEAGFQSVLMAPTEILARQHYETIAQPLADQGIRVIMLTGRDKGGPRAEKLVALADGSAAVAVGTHALFQDDVEFHRLALAVVDEQHRFGVSERKRLQDKGEGVHLMAMSATPIPRTLELTVFGDLDVSRIDEKPPGRTPVATRAVPMPRLPEIVERLRQAVKAGAQAFWICPMITDNEMADLAAAEKRLGELRRALGPAAVGMVHGKLGASEKDAVMAEFAEGRLPVLVATTVVEVGVNVPNATIMVIEQAERFGLAQLHQLRGRVGRGRRESACVLLYDPPLSKIAEQRLDILRRTDDGFVIAEKDLELRGGGDPLGLRQSGFPDYRLVDPAAHRDLIAVAADDARLVLARDPHLKSPRGKALTVLQELFDWRPAGLTDAG